MAGIGFELKKLFYKKGISRRIAGIFYSSFVTIGHMLLILALLVAFTILMNIAGTSQNEQDLFSSAVLYAFVFSLLFSSGISMVLTRYLADMIFEEKNEKILPSLYGSLALVMGTAGVIGIVFYALSPLPFYFKVLAYLLYIQLTAIFIVMNYISAIKQYKLVAFSFFFGMLSAFAIALGMLLMKHGYTANGLLLAMNSGFLATLFLLIYNVKRFFRTGDDSYFEFLRYFRKHKRLFWINFFYTFGLYAQNFVFWFFSSYKEQVGHTFIFAPDYDMATFLAMLTVLWMTVLFVVRMETNFYEKYRNYVLAIGRGTLADIDIARKEMGRLMGREFLYVAEIQLIITLFLTCLAMGILPLFYFAPAIVEMFPFLCCGYYFSFLMFLSITMLLYFNEQGRAFAIAGLFAFLSPVFSWITVWLIPDWDGAGYVLAGFICVLLGMRELSAVTKDVDYLIFCKQPSEEGAIERRLADNNDIRGGRL